MDLVLPSTELDLNDLRVIHAIVRAAGVTRAASRLALSQSAVSHRLRLVEERLGVKLFERQGRGLRPLPPALRLADMAERLVRPLATTESELVGSPALPPLRLAAQCYTGYEWLPPALAALTREHDRLQVEVVAEATADPIGALSSDRLDLAVCSAVPTHSRFHCEPLFEDELVAVLPAGHSLARRRWIDGLALAEEQLFLFHLSERQREHFRKRLFPAGGGFTRVHRVPLTEAIVALVRAGAGASILPQWSVEDAAQRGDVAIVRLTRRGLKRRWQGVYSWQSPHRETIAALLEMLRRSRLRLGSARSVAGSRPRAGTKQ